MGERTEAELIAAFCHTEYERIAPLFGYETPRDTAVPWDHVPSGNKALLIAVAQSLLDSGLVGRP